MAFTWKLNGSHDLGITSRGKLEIVYGPDEVKQRILVALRHYWQEYFLNVQDGVPWYEVILGSKNKKTVELIIRRAILEVPGVIGIVALDVITSTTISRHLEIYGTVEVEKYEGTLNILAMNFVMSAESNEFASQDSIFAGDNWEFAFM